MLDVSGNKNILAKGSVNITKNLGKSTRQHRTSIALIVAVLIVLLVILIVVIATRSSSTTIHIHQMCVTCRPGCDLDQVVGKLVNGLTYDIKTGQKIVIEKQINQAKCSMVDNVGETITEDAVEEN